MNAYNHPQYPIAQPMVGFEMKSLYDTPTKKWAWGGAGFAVALGLAFWADKKFGKKKKAA